VRERVSWGMEGEGREAIVERRAGCMQLASRAGISWSSYRDGVVVCGSKEGERRRNLKATGRSSTLALVQLPTPSSAVWHQDHETATGSDEL